MAAESDNFTGLFTKCLPLSPHLTVFFDGACPLCRKEISFYQRRTARDSGDNPIAWIDVSRQPVDLPAGLTAQGAMARFHVSDNNRLYSGGEAFAVLWQHVPGFRVAGRLLQRPGLRQLTNFLYNRFLVFRPRLQRWMSSKAGSACDGTTCR